MINYELGKRKINMGYIKKISKVAIIAKSDNYDIFNNIPAAACKDNIKDVIILQDENRYEYIEISYIEDIHQFLELFDSGYIDNMIPSRVDPFNLYRVGVYYLDREFGKSVRNYIKDKYLNFKKCFIPFPKALYKGKGINTHIQNYFNSGLITLNIIFNSKEEMEQVELSEDYCIIKILYNNINKVYI